MKPSDASAQAVEKPENGLPGLRHWRYDLPAGILVSLVGLPLSLGIAVASGAPPIAGLISAIIAGLIFPFLGGAYVTISGPAAGLAPALLAGMLTLGNGDLAGGYPLLLVAICLTGLVQVVLSLFKAGRFAIFFPISVVEGMLAAIGLMIIVKQIPALVGHLTPPIKSVPAAVGRIPDNLLHLDPGIFFIGGVSLFLLFFLSKRKDRWATIIPPPLLVVGLGMALGWLLQLQPAYLIHLPDDVLQHGITPPDFLGVWQRPDLWISVLLIVVTLTLIDGTESLATIAAVDKIDPFRRKSDPNRTLRAMGISNVLSSVAGGLTIIPGGVKSSANVQAGGRTLWANGYYALFLALYLWAGKDLINRIPLAALAAVLIYVGWRLCEPRVFRKILSVGRDQLFAFIVTITVTLLTTDLLFGIVVGMVVKFALLFFFLGSPIKPLLTGQLSLRQSVGSVSANLTDLFTSPVFRVETGNGSFPCERCSIMSSAESVTRGAHGGADGSCRLSLSSITCMNLIKLEKALANIPAECQAPITVNASGRIIDHTAMEYLHHFQEQRALSGHQCTISGLERFRAFSDHELSPRLWAQGNAAESAAPAPALAVATGPIRLDSGIKKTLRILLAVDGSEHSQEAARAMVHLAAGSEVVLLHALDAPAPMMTPEVAMDLQTKQEREAYEEGARLLKRVETGLPEQVRVVSSRIEVGSPTDSILTAADMERPDCIVLGARGLGQMGEMLIGSVSHRIVTHAARPTLVVKNPLPSLRRVLLAVAGPQDADAVIGFLSSRPFNHPPEIRVITVLSPGAQPQPGDVSTHEAAQGQTTPDATRDFERPIGSLEADWTGEKIQADAKRFTEGVAARLSAQDYSVSTETVLGPPAPSIARHAEEVGADLIVVGSRSRSGLTRVLLGSVSHAVLHLARAAVLVVPVKPAPTGERGDARAPR